jgi:hypothetical protein
MTLGVNAISSEFSLQVALFRAQPVCIGRASEPSCATKAIAPGRGRDGHYTGLIESGFF